MQSSAALVVAVEDAASDLHFDSSIPILEIMLMTYVTDSLRTVRHLGEYVHSKFKTFKFKYEVTVFVKETNALSDQKEDCLSKILPSSCHVSRKNAVDVKYKCGE